MLIMNFKIVGYNSTYCNEVSNIVTRNLLEVNSEDYGMEKVRKHILEFTPEKIEEYSKGDKIFVALDDKKVVGTLRVASDWYGGKDDYVLLTIFVLPEYHGKGIGRLLVEAGEKYTESVKCRKITIPASVAAHKFYHKLGYEYIDGTEPNSNDVILMRKIIN
jgi:GNAT superfamily N-acetyltransferase